MLYLLIILFAAVAGGIRLWLLQRQEQKMELAEDFRSQLQRLSTQPLAHSDESDKKGRAGRRERKASRAEALAVEEDFFVEEFEPAKDPRYTYLGNRRLWRKPREPWFVTYRREPVPVVEEFTGPRRSAGWAIDAFWREPAVEATPSSPARQARHLPPFEGARPQSRRAALEQHRRDAARRRIELRRTGQVRA